MTSALTHPPLLAFGGDGPVLHFAHANGFPPDAYRPWLTALARRYRVVAAPHRPLWSREDPWQTFHDWHTIGRDLIAALDAHDLRGVIGVGHSLGGVATLYAAVQRPDLFSRLALIDPVFLDPALLALAQQPGLDPTALPLVAGALRRRAVWASREEAWTAFRPKPVFAGLSDEALWAYVTAVLQPRPDGSFALAYPREWEARIYSLPPADVWELLGRVTLPTLAVRGAQSDTLSAACWQLWQRTQPAATFVELPGLGHLLPLEDPTAVAAVLGDWLATS